MKELDERIRREWDAAEQAIKLAEQTSGKVTIPAVNELRYAGRRVVDALSTADEASRASFYEGALEHCRRARFDAIDANVLYWMRLVDEHDRYSRSGRDDLSLAKVRKILSNISTAIDASRETYERDRRVETYERIENLLREIDAISSRTENLTISTRALEEDFTRKRWMWLSVLAAVLGVAASSLSFVVTKLMGLLG